MPVLRTPLSETLAFYTASPSVCRSVRRPDFFARARVPAALLASALLLFGCGGKTDAAGPSQGAAPPPAEVGVVTVALGDVGLVTELPGRIEASRVAEVRARAAGILQKRLFVEGRDVKAGQALFVIDPAPYAAAADSAQAQLLRAEANLAQAKTTAERYAPLVEANAISREEYAAATTAHLQAQADVAMAKAALKTARINLGYAHVSAPISGRIGRALVTEGALVGQGEATALARVQQIDPVYVNFTQSASEVMRLRRALEAGQLKRAPGEDAASVNVLLEDGSNFGNKGRLLFSDLSVDPSTGQVTLRAELPNPGGLLLPGLFVRVQIEQAQAVNAISLPQQAVTRTGQGDSVMVVDAAGKVEPRTVKISRAKDGQWVVQDGLVAGEQVMVDGFQKLRGNAPVKAVPWSPIGAAPLKAETMAETAATQK